MRSPVPDYLLEVVQTCDSPDGSVADYIPELATVDPDVVSIGLATVTGADYAAGESEHAFTIQSMSKPFVYALALEDRGLDEVMRTVDVEPSGEAFNEISLERDTGRPRNPMINAGAIAAHGLVTGDDADDRWRRVHGWFEQLAGRELALDDAVLESEWEHAHRNLALGHLMASTGLIDDPVDVVRGYVQQCSLQVTVRDLAVMAATLANGGVHPITEERLMSASTARQVLSVMTTCGMYDAAGDWLSTVGIPAKSGVSGGIIGVLPGQVGVAVFAPRLDQHGNSVRGVDMMTRLSHDMGMHLMNPARPARSALAGIDVDGDTTTYRLHGDLLFVSTEALLSRLEADPPTTPRVVVDLTDVDEIGDVARRMALEAERRLRLDGIDVHIEGLRPAGG